MEFLVLAGILYWFFYVRGSSRCPHCNGKLKSNNPEGLYYCDYCKKDIIFYNNTFMKPENLKTIIHLGAKLIGTCPYCHCVINYQTGYDLDGKHECCSCKKEYIINNSRIMKLEDATSDYKNEVRCPYCGSRVNISNEPGFWNCPDCKNQFCFRYDKIWKSEEVCSESVLDLTILLAKLAKADGIVSEAETHKLSDIFKMIGLTKDQISEAGILFNQAKKNTDEYEFYLRKISNNQDKEFLISLFDCLFMMVMADGIFDKRQEEFLLKAKQIFRLSDNEYEEIKAQYLYVMNNKDLDKYYKILKCSSESSLAEIKKAYRDLMLEYHPDKYFSKDLPESIIEMMTQKCQEVQEAYNTIIEARG